MGGHIHILCLENLIKGEYVMCGKIGGRKCAPCPRQASPPPLTVPPPFPPPVAVGSKNNPHLLLPTSPFPLFLTSNAPLIKQSVAQKSPFYTWMVVKVGTVYCINF